MCIRDRFTSVLKMFASGPVAIGAAVFTGMLIGTGAAIMLAGKGISAAGDGVQKVADGVEQMAGLKDTANFTDIAQALGALGPALISLTAGGVLDSITSFFGADSPFDKLVEGINEFKGVDQSALTNVNSSASALSKLSAFDSELDASNLKKYADQLERVGEALEKMNDELTKNKGRGRTKGQSEASTALSAMTGSGSGGGISGDQLNTTMKELLEAVRINTTVTKQGFRSISEEM